jgi:hypothetical protein
MKGKEEQKQEREKPREKKQRAALLRVFPFPGLSA